MAPAPFVYISGYPGVGKLTVAKELSKLLPNAKIVDAHTIIDPAANLHERHTTEYASLRNHIVSHFTPEVLQAVDTRIQRRGMLDSIATSQSIKDVTMIFTDIQPATDWGIATVSEFLQAAKTRDSLFISIILECTAEDNCYRLMTDGRGKNKLKDQEYLLELRECQPLYRFRIDEELVLNTTNMAAYHAARKIVDFMRTVVPKEESDQVFGDLI
ncbi:MAG: hypothetical protein Q9212_006954 [Teloschistes hypoglaucus]